MKKQIILLSISLVAILIVSCSSTNKLSKVEDFEKFSAKFYSDSSFQYSRIQFPLELVEYMGNIKQDPESEYQSNVETKQLTKKTLPRMIKSFEDYPEMYDRKLDTTGTGIDEKIYIPSSGYNETRSFILNGKKWYLWHVNIMNF